MPSFTPQQQAAIGAIGSGQSIAKRAVAGAGKTTTLIAGIAQVTAPGIALAFNKKNAEELGDKIKLANPASRVEAKTLNGLGHRVWSDHIRRRLIVDMDKTKNLIKELNLKLSTEEWTGLQRLVSLAKSRALTTGKLNTPPLHIQSWRDMWDEADGDLDLFDSIAEHAVNILNKSITMAFEGKIDFDDQLYMPVVFNARFPAIPFVSVDEAQDLSPLQHEMVARLKPEQIVVVGDPNQAIYAFRGASSSSFEELITRFNLPEFPLTVSFRCPKAVARLAQDYVPDFSVLDSAPEGVVRKVKEASTHGMALCRYNAPLLRLAFQALRQRKSVNYLGRDFLSGIKALNSKHPTKADMEAWLKAKFQEAKTDGARKRARDQYDSILTLHDVAAREGMTVEAVISDLLRQSKLGAALTLATVHKAKGLEFPEVTFLAYDEAAEGGQERNINYVGVTRAQSVLNLQEKEW